MAGVDGEHLAGPAGALLAAVGHADAGAPGDVPEPLAGVALDLQPAKFMRASEGAGCDSGAMVNLDSGRLECHGGGGWPCVPLLEAM